MTPTRVLSTTNTASSVTLDGATDQLVSAPGFIPLGTNGGTAGGELFVKVGLVGNIATSAAPGPGSGTVTVVTSSTAAQTFAASAASRGGVAVMNNSTALLYVKLGDAAASTNFTAALAPLSSGIGGYYEVPFEYRGLITGIWAASNGNAMVTVLT